MFSRSFSVSLSILALAASSVAFAGCAADTGASTASDETETTMQSAEAPHDVRPNQAGLE